MTINDLYKLALDGGQEEENQLFRALAVRFRIFAAQRIRGDDDINDIVQETLMTILKNYRTTDIEVSFQAWAYKILERQIQAFQGNRARRQTRDNLLWEKIREIDQPEEIDIKALKDVLLKCLKKIYRSNLRFARILNMHYQGYTTGEICEALKITPANCYTILKRARSLLEYCLEKGDIE